MRAQRFSAHHNGVHAAERVVVGTCPNCGLVLVVLNAYEAWPWVECVCSWGGATTALTSRDRFEAVPRWRRTIISAESPADLDREGR